MHSLNTLYGTVLILDREAMFKKLLDMLQATAKPNFFSKLFKKKTTVALSGGSTPITFYKWLADSATPHDLEYLKTIYWFTSDERCVPLANEESNFGNADRLLFTPHHFPKETLCPWPVHPPPPEAATTFESFFKNNFSRRHLFDLCLLGIGEDCHTASIFPNSELLPPPPYSPPAPRLQRTSKASACQLKLGEHRLADRPPSTHLFASVFVENKGWRLTITPYGLQKCKKIVVLVEGEKKAEALCRVFYEPFDPFRKPIQLLKNFATHVTWLVDPSAASKLNSV